MSNFRIYKFSNSQNYQIFNLLIVRIDDEIFQLQYEERAVDMRIRERIFDVVGASSSQRATDPLYCEILDGPSERSASTCGERPRWQMGCLRRKKHMVRHHLRWNIAWYRDLHLEFWPDTRLVRMGGSFLHSRYTATDLVCPVLLVFR